MPNLYLNDLEQRGFDVLNISHAEAILAGDFPEEFDTLMAALDVLDLPITEIIGSGGGETQFTQRLRWALTDHGWNKHVFEVQKIIDGSPKTSVTHELDHVKNSRNGAIGCEIEWNNKDPFFDRDLENFKRLHADLVVSVGIVITRGASLQANMRDVVHRYAVDRGIKDFASLKQAGVEPTSKQKTAIQSAMQRQRNALDFATAWADVFVKNKYSSSTTHWLKLLERVARGVGNPCPLLLIGLPASIVRFDTGPVEELAEADADDV